MHAITKAKSQLVMSFPFWGRLAFQLEYVEDPNIETMRTDGRQNRYNKDFVESLSNAELQGVIAHEISHCAFGHIFRKGERDHEDFNIAGDYAINGILKAAGLTLPAGHLDDPQFHGQFVEQIYAGIHGKRKDTSLADPQQDTVKHNFGGCGEFTNAGGGPADFLSPAQQKQLENEWRIATEQAAQIAKACGVMGEDLERQIDKLRASIVDWRDVLASFVESCVERRYSWTKPNRRFIGSGIYLPSLVPDGIGEIAVCVDTSGSISDDELAQFASEIFCIIENVKPEKVSVVYCHHQVTNVETFTHDDPPDRLQPVGSGGTRFTPAFDWVNEHMETPVCLIYLTDLDCRDFPREQNYPVLWVSTNKDPARIAPMGETIHMGRT
jgi:predicted metal-dependent peptidase